MGSNPTPSAHPGGGAADVDIRTERLLLRRWRESDRDPWAAMGADPRVMRHFPETLSRAEADAMFDRLAALFDEHGYGLWAVERRDTGDFIGFVGLNRVSFEARFTPAVEIGWRLSADAWGHGYATEAARAVVDHAFGALGIRELVSFTVPANEASWRVMERIGMTRDPADDFDHPRVSAGDPLRRHVLYRLRPGSTRFVADPRHRYSYELRPDSQLDGRLRAIAADLEARGLIDAGASTAPRFHPHLTMCRAAVERPEAVAAAAGVIASRGAAVCFDHAGVFGDGRIVWLGPAAPDALEAARIDLLATLDPDEVDPLVLARPWTPHVTIAYAVPEPAQAEALSVVAAQLPLTGSWRCVQSWDLDVRPTLLGTERTCVDAPAAG